MKAPDNLKPTTIYNSRKNYIALLIGASLGTIVGLLRVFLGTDTCEYDDYLILTALVLFIVVALYKLMNSKEILHVSDEGITIRENEFIEWGYISSVRTEEQRGYRGAREIRLVIEGEGELIVQLDVSDLRITEDELIDLFGMRSV